jgi:hypothetical protein
VLLSVPTGYVEQVLVFFHQWRSSFKFCWSLEAFRLPVDRSCCSDCAFQMIIFLMNMNSRFRDHYKKTGLLSTEAGKCKRAQQKLENGRLSRTEHFSRQRNLNGLIGESDTHSKWWHFLLLGKIIAIIRLHLNICSELLLDYYLLWFLYSAIFFGNFCG